MNNVCTLKCASFSYSVDTFMELCNSQDYHNRRHFCPTGTSSWWPSSRGTMAMLLWSVNSFSYWTRLTRTTNLKNTVGMILYLLHLVLFVWILRQGLPFSPRQAWSSRSSCLSLPVCVARCPPVVSFRRFLQLSSSGSGLLLLSKASTKAVRTSERLPEIPECQGTVSRGLDLIHNHVSG